MDQERLNEIQEYLRANPTTPPGGYPGGVVADGGGQHVHIHYHQAPYNTEPVEQNKGQKVLERYAPYFVMFLGGFIIVAGGTVILMFAFTAIAMILLTLLGCFAGLALLAAVLVVLIKSSGESRALRDLARASSKRRR